VLKGALFDWDGVVVDSSAAHRESWERLAEERGLALPENHFALGFGRKNQVIIPEIYKWATDPEAIEELGNRKEAIYREILIESGLEPLPGAIDLFRELKAAGIPMAVGTSTPLKNVETVIGLIGAAGMFDAIISAEDVSHGKPDPEVFLKGAAALGVEPQDCVVFEDAVYGIEAGLAGGMKVVALTTTHPAGYFDDVQPHKIVRDLSQVSISLLRGLW
jgi:HAD superfamily hydrolase (TIGR01509 family)